MDAERQNITKTEEDAFIPGSIGLVRIAGIPVRLHFTFILFFVFLVFAGVGKQQSALGSLIYITAIFGSVILHELGHALTGLRYGVKTVEIVMFPIGGVARLARMPKAREEFWIALAGPAVNFVIAAGLLGFLASRGELVPMAKLVEPSDANLLQRIALGNLLLGGFNLLPAFPMDGGRILRSLLARRRTEEQATASAAKAGQYLAILMGLYGLLSGQFMLIFIAFFVYLGAAQESAVATGRMLTQGTPVRAAMVTEYHTISHGQTIRDAANLLLSTSQQDFPVVHGGKVIGLLGRTALLKAMATMGPDAYVSGAMDRDFVRIPPDKDLSEALLLIGRAGSCALVMDEEDNLLGLLTAENLSEYLLLRRVGMQPPVTVPEDHLSSHAA